MSDTFEGSNTSMTFDDLVKETRKLGTEKAEGDDSLAKLFLRVVRASAEGIIDLTKNKHGDGVDDARFLFSTFANSVAKKSVHERTQNGMKANVSKLRQAVVVGSLTTCDPIDLYNRVPTLLRGLQNADEKVQPAFAAYVSVARAQINAAKNGDGDLSDDEIKSAMRKAEAEEPTLEKFLASEVKRMEKAISGENGFKCQDPRLINAFEQVRDLHADVVKGNEVSKAQTELAALQTRLAMLGVSA